MTTPTAGGPAGAGERTAPSARVAAPGSAMADTTTSLGGRHGPTAGPTSAPRLVPPRARRPPRLTTLQLRRVDPWTVLKLALIVSIVMFFVWMIAIGVLYLSLGSLDVWSKINTVYNTLVVTPDTTKAPASLITPGKVFGVTAVIGAINVVLFTALSTIAAFIYNAAAGMAGGMEMTLGERD